MRWMSGKAHNGLPDYFKKIGAGKVQILETQKHPVVFAELSQAGEDKPTILVYGHYDVQPADPDLWDSAPFEPAVRDGQLYARGASDMKRPTDGYAERDRVHSGHRKPSGEF